LEGRLRRADLKFCEADKKKDVWLSEYDNTQAPPLQGLAGVLLNLERHARGGRVCFPRGKQLEPGNCSGGAEAETRRYVTK
jgi:hypothetical protein